MNIKITIAGQIITATLEESDSAGTFRHAPLTLPFEDYAETEKIAYLSRQLTTQGAPKGHGPGRGDISYYAPGAIWRSSIGTLAIQPGSSKLGRIGIGSDALTTQPSGTLTIDAVK